MVSVFQLKVEPFGGADISTACREAVALATLARVIVGFDFNGVHCMARPDGDAAELETKWRDALASKSSYKVVSA